MVKAMAAMARKPACQEVAAMTNATIRGRVRPPKLLSIVVIPIMRPRVFGNQRGTSLPVGRMLAPEKATNCRKLRAYQCHSSVISGLSRKLTPNSDREATIKGRAPYRSIVRPRRGPERLPTAMKEREALTIVRSHPNLLPIF